ncbi:T9SS type A sorting domain-containing protein [Dyadobacter sandarakinus]|uniref:T9SS type A sorting domain-containing protein n=1 Tax=Dyadobacter sandarakinus TaxID=2747268 RepID=A0ABX7I225_9BACT|nr:T9SS type A sorting domain-containing protein [Dyadobacter sandarakinus]QRQ99757.1 T9SS type A sorting domain-containing protein [Dyadobacter sandarakinus]
MRRQLLQLGAICLFALHLNTAFAQKPTVKWDKTFAIGSLTKTIPAKDGGYLLAGRSSANAGFDKTENSKGGIDYWVIKIDKDGNKQWDKTFGGSGNDELTVAAATSDGGFILAGSSQSGSGGDKTEPAKPGNPVPQDIWIVKINSEGQKEWDRTIGTSNADGIIGIHEAVGGGYLLVAPTSGPPSGDKTASSVGGDNFVEEWIVKLSPNGLKLWDKIVGSGGLCRPVSSQILSDGGLLIGNVATYEGHDDKFNMMRVDSEGNMMWYRQLGGELLSECIDIKQSVDGGFLLGGYTTGDAIGDQSQTASGTDYWVIKTDSALNKIWDRVLGSVDTGDDENQYGYDYLYSITETTDGGVIAAGLSNSVEVGKDKTEPGLGGGADMWVVKLDASGATKWDKTIGGTSGDVAFSVLPASDGGYILAGYSGSPKNIYKSEDPKGAYDIWVLKIEETQPPLPVTLKSFSVAKESETAALTWETTSETNSDHFELQHSLDGKDWTELTSINAQGESKKMSFYNYTHTAPVFGSDNLYRLKMVDADGTFAYSKIQHVKFESDFEVVVYPNPASDVIMVKGLNQADITSVQWFNSGGRVISKVRSMNVPKISPGLYTVKIQAQGGSLFTSKVVVK